MVEAVVPGRTTKGKAEVNRAAIYARVLDKSQDGGDKTSIAEQIGDMEAYCESKGLTITARYQEVGRGWSKKRPEFQRMLAMPDADASTPSCAGSPTASAGTTPISTDPYFLSGKNSDDAGQRTVRLRSGEVLRPHHRIGSGASQQKSVGGRCPRRVQQGDAEDYSLSKGFCNSTPSWTKSLTLRVTTVIRCTVAVAAIMASSAIASDLLCMSRAHSRKAAASIGNTP